MKGEKNMKEEIKKTLLEQLALLAEMSKDAKAANDPMYVCNMTAEIVSISETVLLYFE